MKLKSTILFILTVFIVFLFSNQLALAHSALLKTDPPNYETLEESPTKIEVTFQEPIVSHSKSIQVRRTNNEYVALTEVRLSTDQKTITAELGETLENGLYMVDINVVALDGDVVNESFQFHVEADTPKDLPLILLNQAPLDGKIIQEPPTTIDLWFNQPVEITAIGLFNSMKEDIPLGQPYPDPLDPSHLIIPIEGELERGTHQVTWYAKPLHTTNFLSEKVDVFYFAIEEYTPITKDLLSEYGNQSFFREIGLKQVAYFFIFLSLMSLFGGTLLTQKIVGYHDKRWRITSFVLSSLFILGVILLMISQSSQLTDVTLNELIRIKFIWIPLLQCILVVAGLLMKRFRIYLFGIGLLLIPFYIGHATYPKYGGMLPMLLSIVHVFSASVWMGGILALLIPMNKDFKEWIHQAGPTFSKWAAISLPFIILTGIWMTLIYVPSFTLSSLWISDWGRSILYKTVVTLIIFAIGFIQRRAIARMVEKGTKLLKRRLRYEVIYILLLLFFVSVVVISSPSAAEQAIYEVEIDTAAIPVKLDISPLQEGLNELTLTFEDPNVEEVDIDFHMPPDFNVSYKAFKIDDTTFKISGNLIHTPGRTDVTIKAHTNDDQYDYQYRLIVPGEMMEE
ncbi:copper resistance protein CopC [Bacillus pinisoli]|uniref:copper resistance protein CopC n=1 Tax=Bacillus pinisoli TaxID=2901866 RepID=UPI001FF3B064|nr:copper resistance protein CopC [Bacillus pinisoli]